MTDEYIAIIDSQGIPTGEVRLKSEAHRLGLLHASVHIWFYTMEGKVMLQKRAPHKDTFPNLWDISVAGHIGIKETPEHAVLREVQEEIGLAITFNDFVFIGTYWSTKQPKLDLFDNELHYIYLSEFKGDMQQLSLQEEEVTALKWLSISTFMQKVGSLTVSNQYVPHGVAYYQLIHDAIKDRIY